MRGATLALGLTLIAAAVSGAPTAAVAAAECKMQLQAELPVTMAGGQPLLEGTIKGEAAHFLIDTGAGFSVLTEATVDRHQLKATAVDGARAVGIGGAFNIKVLRTGDFTVGHLKGSNSQFVVLPGSLGAKVDGILGQDIFGMFDVEYDLGAGTIRLFKAKDCKGYSLAYWSKTPSATALEGMMGPGHALRTTIVVNGKPIRAILDTGAQTSILSLDAAARAGVTPQSPGAVAAGLLRGVGPAPIDIWRVPVDSFGIGDEEVRNTRLTIGDMGAYTPKEGKTGSHLRTEIMDTPEMLIGIDFFLSHRILIAGSQRRAFFTYGGGGVFRMEQDPGLTRAASAATTVAAPADAAGYSRRGAGLLSRRDFAAASADFSQAIALEPAVASTVTTGRRRAWARGGRSSPTPTSTRRCG